MLCNRKEKVQKSISPLLETCIFREMERDLKTKHKNTPVHHSCSEKRYRKSDSDRHYRVIFSNRKERGTTTRGTTTRGTTTSGTTTRGTPTRGTKTARGIEHQACDGLQILPVPGQWCGLSARCVCGWLGIFMHARLPLFSLIFTCTVLLGLQIVIVHVLFRLMLFAQSEILYKRLPLFNLIFLCTVLLLCKQPLYHSCACM